MSKLNQGTIGLMVSQADMLATALQISKSVDHTNGLRVLPIIGRGGLQSINDLLYLRSVDAALLSSDALAYARKNGLYSDSAAKISYLAKVSNVPVVVLARRDFATLEKLRGMRIAVGTSESDEFIAADLIFGSFGLNYKGVGMSAEQALEAMRNGTIDAAVFASAGTVKLLEQVDKASGFHVISISANEDLAKTYSPAMLAHADLPNLVEQDFAVETVASSVVLAVRDQAANSERWQKLNTFNGALSAHYFAKLNPLQSTNFSATVPGWKSFTVQRPPRKQPAAPVHSITALQ